MLNLTGSVCSILGLALSLYIAYSVKRIHAGYIRQVMVPSYVRKLAQVLKQLQADIDRQDEQAIKDQIEISISLINGLHPHLRKNVGMEDLAKTATHVARASGSTLFRDSRNYVSKLKALVELVKLTQKEDTWRRNDG